MVLKKYRFFLYYFFLVIAIKLYRRKLININFSRLDKLYLKDYKWEKDLDIYSVAMPLFHTSRTKKHKCILLISGFRDTPYLWDDIIDYFKKDNMDFYAPRTHGFGRRFFQDSEPKDWIITYLEAIHLLQELYEEIDIVALSTGCVIALYLTQFNYKCKINNLFLCAPFLLKKYNFLFYLFFDSCFSKILAPLFKYTLKYHIKTNTKYAGFRETNNNYNSVNDFYDIIGDFSLEEKLMKFINFRPENIFVDNIIILNPNDDQIIGDIYLQYKILKDILNKNNNKNNNKNIEIINIPNYDESEKNIINLLPKLCGHVMFKEELYIVKNIYEIIKKYFYCKK
jgi:esterase/lipase